MVSKTKISATVSPERLAEARAVTGTSNISQLIDAALEVLINREQRWIDAHPDDELPGQVGVDLSSVPWDEG
jgi:hypothetical protein